MQLVGDLSRIQTQDLSPYLHSKPPITLMHDLTQFLHLVHSHAHCREDIFPLDLVSQFAQ
jgi:hypothetical protein